MEGEISRIDLEENEEINFRKPIMIGSGILIAYFILFGFNVLPICFHSEFQQMIFGDYYDSYLWVVVGISIIGLILGSFGLYFFSSGLRKMRKSMEKTEKQRLRLFIILYLIFMITANLLILSNIIFIFITSYVPSIPITPSLQIFFTLHFSSYVLFGFVVLLVIVQNFFLKKSKLIDLVFVRRPVVHFFLPGILVVWIFFIINNYTVTVYIPEYFHLPLIISQFITSLFAAGVYLELCLKVKKSKQEVNTKSKKKKLNSKKTNNKC